MESLVKHATLAGIRIVLSYANNALKIALLVCQTVYYKAKKMLFVQDVS
jgi:hypothetical protein